MSHTIMLIDGDTSEKAIMSKALRDKLSYHTIEMRFETFTERYLASLSEKTPDVILLDISGDARECESKIRHIKMISPDIPVVALARYGDYESAMSCIHSGAEDFLMKPVAIERMRITFRNIVRMRELRRAQAPEGMPERHGYLSFSLFNEDGNIRRIYELEKEAIVRAVQYYNGRMSEAARRLGIGRSTLYRKLNNSKAA